MRRDPTLAQLSASASTHGGSVRNIHNVIEQLSSNFIVSDGTEVDHVHTPVLMVFFL